MESIAAAARSRKSLLREDHFVAKIGLGFDQCRVILGSDVRCLAALRAGGSWVNSPIRGSRKARLARLTAKFRYDDGENGGNKNGGGKIGGIVLNAAITGALAYLTVTGKLGWVFDAVISLWLFFILAPIVALVAYFWFIDREIVTGNCPNCGNEFQVFEFAVKDELQLCPYCTQPFKVDNKVFVRDGTRYKDDMDGNVVDVEAEVLDD